VARVEKRYNRAAGSVQVIYGSRPPSQRLRARRLREKLPLGSVLARDQRLKPADVKLVPDAEALPRRKRRDRDCRAEGDVLAVNGEVIIP
jgi:hypothetical protein